MDSGERLIWLLVVLVFAVWNYMACDYLRDLHRRVKHLEESAAQPQGGKEETS